jgi:hypothetical protein
LTELHVSRIADLHLFSFESNKAATAGNWNIELLIQSTQLYLGFATGTSGLIVQVLRAFDNFDPILLDNAFLTLQLCIEQIILIHGKNNYPIPHVGKAAMRKEEGKIPLRWCKRLVDVCCCDTLFYS